MIGQRPRNDNERDGRRRNRLPLALLGVVILSGCAEYRARIAAERAAADNAKCLSYGAARGDPAYVQCRAQLDAARTQAEATAAAAPMVVQPMPNPPNPFPGTQLSTAPGTIWHP